MHDGVKCPVCRHMNPGPETDQDSTEWVQGLEADLDHARENATTRLGDGAKLELCCGCKEAKIVTIATKFCIDCQERLCTSCAAISHRLKALRNHTVTDLSPEGNTKEDRDMTKGISQFLSCPRHSDQITTLICKDNDSLYCLRCVLDEEIKNVNLIEIESIVDKEDVEKESDRIKFKLDKLATLSEAIVAAKSSTEAENKKAKQDIMIEIREMRAKMNSVFDHLENNVAEQCNALIKKHTIDALEDTATLQDTLTDIKESITILEQTRSIGSKNFLYVILNQLKRKLKKYENTLLQMKSQYKKFDFRLEVQDTLLNNLAIGPNETDVLASITERENDVVLPDYSERFLLKNCKIYKVSKYKIKVKYTSFDPLYTGLVSLSDNRLVLIDNNNGICCLVKNYDVIDLCKLTPVANEKDLVNLDQPCGISNLKNEMVVVSVPNARKLYFLTISEEIKITCEIDTTFQPLALQGLRNGDIAVSSAAVPSVFRILRFHDFHLQERICLEHDISGRVFRSFFFMRIDEERSHVLQSCHVDKKLYCFDFEGNPKFTYSHPQIQENAGVELDTDGNIYLCDTIGSSVHIISPEGIAIRRFKFTPDHPLVLKFKQNAPEFIVTNAHNKQYELNVYVLRK